MIDVGDDTSAAALGEGDSGFNFWQHGARFEIAVFDEV